MRVILRKEECVLEGRGKENHQQIPSVKSSPLLDISQAVLHLGKCQSEVFTRGGRWRIIRSRPMSDHAAIARLFFNHLGSVISQGKSSQHAQKLLLNPSQDPDLSALPSRIPSLHVQIHPRCFTPERWLYLQQALTSFVLA